MWPDRATALSRVNAALGKRRPRKWFFLIGALVLLDGFAVYASMRLAYAIRVEGDILAYSAPHEPAAYRQLTLASVAVWLLIFALFRLYQKDMLLGGVAEYEAVLRGCTFGVFATIAVSFFWRTTTEPSRGWLSLVWLISCILLGIERFLVRRIVYALRKRGHFTTRVLIVGANQHGIAVAEQWLQAPASGISIVGFLDDFKPVGTSVTNGLRVIGRPSALEALAYRTAAEEVIVIAGAVAAETFEEIVSKASRPNGFTIRLSPGFYELLANSVSVTNRSFVPLFTISGARLTGGDALLKALLDYGLGVLFSCLLLPLTAVIGAGLQLRRPRPPLLDRFEVAGLHSKRFTMFKFHTRRADAGATWLERKLRSNGLDKLPQLANVMTGSMGLVGPRPRVLLPGKTPECSGLIPPSVKPGIIGPWTATRLPSSAEESAAELYYVRNWTIWLDLQILFQSTLMLLTRGRAGVSPLPEGSQPPESADG